MPSSLHVLLSRVADLANALEQEGSIGWSWVQTFTPFWISMGLLLFLSVPMSFRWKLCA
jgi:hypothetical protein